jgi:hypothetical protein
MAAYNTEAVAPSHRDQKIKFREDWNFSCKKFRAAVIEGSVY